MYCSIHDAWDEKNSFTNLSKRYQENFNPLDKDELSSFKINNNNIQINENKKPLYVERQDARYNKSENTVYNVNMEETEDIKTEDIMIDSESEVMVEVPKKQPIKKSKRMECNELVSKVLSCPTCRKMIESKLGVNKNPLQSLVNNEMREIMILILIGLVIMIIIDLFIRISK